MRRKPKKPLNFLNNFDTSIEELREMIEKPADIEPVSIKLFDYKFETDTGNLEYVLFKTRKKNTTHVRVMQIFRVKSVSNAIRVQQSNEEAFKNILNNFGNGGISFVSIYAHDPEQEVFVGYGIVAEGLESEQETLKKRTKQYLNALEDQFRSAFINVEIEEMNEKDEWVLHLFRNDKLTVARGNPKPDTSVGFQTGSQPYSSPVQAGRQVTEVLLKGITAKRKGHMAKGFPFLMYCVFDKIDQMEIQRILFEVENMMGKLAASRESNMSENENFSTPFMIGFGFDSMMGQNHQQTLGMAESSGSAESQSQTHTVGTGEAQQVGKSDAYAEGNSSSRTDSQSDTLTQSKNGGLSIPVANASVGESNAAQQGSSVGRTNTMTNTTTESQANTTSNSMSDATAFGNTISQSTTNSSSEANGTSQGQGKSTNVGGGISGGDGSGMSRRQIDFFFDTILEIYAIYRKRMENSLRDGAFDYRMMILTPDDDSRIRVESLLKQAYTDPNAPFPLRVEKLKKEEERELLKYAKSMTKPLVKEKRKGLFEPYRYSSIATPNEATAFGLPQTNVPGFISSFDPVPQTIVPIGKMEKGIEVGNQWYPDFNMESGHSFNIPYKSLGHIGIFGGTGKGKTVFLQRFLQECYNKFGLNFILFDWTRNHRSMMGHLKDSKKFRYHSFNKEFHPLRLNLVVPPKGVSPYVWNPVIAELMCYSMGLGDRSYRIIIKVLKRTQDAAKKRGITPTMEHFVRMLGEEYSRRMGQHNGVEEMMDNSVTSKIRSQTRFMPSNEQQSFGSMVERMEEWLDTDHPVYHAMCGTQPFMTIEDFVTEDLARLIECASLPSEMKQFVINGITAAIFHYCKSRDMKLKKPVYLIFEEAHSVLQMPTGNEPINITETIFETINREARNYGLYIGYICQSPEKLPPLIFDNLPIKIIFQLPDAEGKNKLISAGGKDPLRMDVDLVKWISRQPRGMCLIRLDNFDRLQDGEFVAVKTKMLPDDPMSDKYFDSIYKKASVKIK